MSLFKTLLRSCCSAKQCLWEMLSNLVPVTPIDTRNIKLYFYIFYAEFLQCDVMIATILPLLLCLPDSGFLGLGAWKLPNSRGYLFGLNIRRTSRIFLFEYMLVVPIIQEWDSHIYPQFKQISKSLWCAENGSRIDYNCKYNTFIKVVFFLSYLSANDFISSQT